VYDFGVGAWAYTSASLYPWIYWYGNVRDWTYYYRDGRIGNRWFYLPASGDYRNDEALNGAVFTESAPRDIPVTSSSSPTRVSDPNSTIIFEAPAGQSGTIRVADLDEAPPLPFPGTGMAIDVSGIEELSLIVPASDLPGDSFPIVYVYGEMQGAFDDEIGYAERWIGLPYRVLPDGSYSFELPLTEPDAPGTWSTDAYWQLKASKKGARHYAITTLSAAARMRAIELETATYVIKFIGALKPSRAIAVTKMRDEATLSYTFGADAYTGFNKLRAWSWGRSFNPVIQLRSPTSTGSLDHETGHYLTHLLVGHSVFDTLAMAGGSVSKKSGHFVRNSIGRNNLLEDYAYIIEYFLSDSGGSYVLETPHITFTDLNPLTRDFPGLEGFAATMLACLHISSDNIWDYRGDPKPIAPLGLGYPDIFEIMSMGATSVDTLRANIASSLSSDKQKALQVLLQRIGWSYYVRGKLVDDKGAPVVGASVASTTKVGDTFYEGDDSNVLSKSDGSFFITGGVFGGDSFIEVTMDEGDPIEVPISIDWTGLTTDVVDLGELVVAALEESDVSFNINHVHTGWPNDFSLNLTANFNVEVQGIDNASFSIDQTNDLQSHEPWINIVVYAPIGSTVKMTGNASITPSGSSGTWDLSTTDKIPWNLNYQTYYASPGFTTPAGSSTQLDLLTPVTEGICKAPWFMFQAALQNESGGYLSGVEGRINITIFGE